MKCLKLYGEHDLRCENSDQPKINETEVLIEVKSVGICKSDIHYFSFGEIGGTKIDQPLILGHEFSGEIFKVGDKVTKFQIGDRVAVDPAISCEKCEFCKRGDPNLCPDVKFSGTPPTMGALADYYPALVNQLFKIPESFSFDDGALLEPLGVALHSVRLAKIKDKLKIAVLGLGPIGLFVMQLSNISGKNNVSGFDFFESRVKFSEKYNPELALKIDRKSYNYQFNFIKNYSRFDIVFETAGSPHAVDMAMKLAKPGGKVLMVGISPESKITIDSTEYRRKGLKLIGVRRMKDTYPETISLVESGKIKLDGIVTHKFSLEMGAQAFKLVENYDDNVIKAVINP
jgi:L-iditol 2-dehydrogenase